MHRYIAFAWNNRKAESHSLASTLFRQLKSSLPTWQCALATEGLRLYHVGERARSSQVYLLDQNAGVILGKVFKRYLDPDCDEHEVVFNGYDTKLIQKSKGRHLVDCYWGRYIALLRDDDGGAHIRILRDPTGAIPCLLTRFRGIDVIFSHIDDCEALGLINCAINWNHVAAYLWHDRLITEDTGLDGVRQVQAGECITIGLGRIDATYYWSPSQIYGERIVEDRQQAIRELRGVIQLCVGAWASCYNNILHELSGGLDSAVVLACLSSLSSKANVVCGNYFTQGAEGDERTFAQKAARLAGCELIETPLLSSARTLDSMLDPTKLATPMLTTLVSESLLTKSQLAEARGIEAVFSGQGGDHLLQRRSTRLIAGEYTWHHGLRPELLNIIADTARFTRKSIWSVIMTATVTGVFRRQQDPYARLAHSLLLTDATRDALSPDSIRHPWVDGAADIPSSKLLQIFDIVDTQHFFGQQPISSFDRVHPLISQPIIELCLQIPSYVLTYSGIDRALVRDAFAKIVPREIIKRTSKGATTGYFNGLLVNNLPFIREFLLDGILVREGVLDTQRTERSLREANLIRSSQLIWPMLDAIRAESWLRTWISDGQRAVA